MKEICWNVIGKLFTINKNTQFRYFNLHDTLFISHGIKSEKIILIVST